MRYEFGIPVAYTRRDGFGPLVPEYSTRGRASNSNDAMQGRQEHGSLAAEMQRRREWALSTYTPTPEPTMPREIAAPEAIIVDLGPLASSVEHTLLAPTSHSHDAA